MTGPSERSSAAARLEPEARRDAGPRAAERSPARAPVRLEIERLVLDSAVLDRATPHPGQIRALREALESELASRLGADPFRPATGTSVALLRARIRWPRSGEAVEIGRRLGAALHGSLAP